MNKEAEVVTYLGNNNGRWRLRHETLRSEVLVFPYIVIFSFLRLNGISLKIRLQIEGIHREPHQKGFQEGRKMRDQEDEIEIGFEGETGEHFMLGKKERMLIRAVLSVSLNFEDNREFISRKLGKEYLGIGENLLREMGGKVEKS
jgi:hypothetical protein